eukprot:scaffold42430_cov42-Phaeocystis_antarctica.AAC.1
MSKWHSPRGKARAANHRPGLRRTAYLLLPADRCSPSTTSSAPLKSTRSPLTYSLTYLLTN